MGLPLGNLTSQLFCNIYMNELDQFVKHELREKYYMRYADDFVVMSDDRFHFQRLVETIRDFLQCSLRLAIHEDKQCIQTVASGVDFLGWVHFPTYRVLRTATKRRMFRNLSQGARSERVASYSGMLSHGNGRKLQARIESFILPS